MAKQRLGVYLGMVFAIVGGLVLGISMQQGIGVGGDAVIYMTSAQNLADGHGLGLMNPDGGFRLIPYFPPFYSLVLTPFALLGWNLSVMALILNIVFYALLIFVVTLWSAKQCRTLYPTVIIGLLLCASPILVPAYSWAMAEPLAMLLGFCGLIFVDNAIHEESIAGLILGAVFCGFSFLTRYSSAAFIAAGALMIWIFRSRSVFDRRQAAENAGSSRSAAALHTRRSISAGAEAYAAETNKCTGFPAALLFGFLSIIPMAAWLIYDYKMTDTVASRNLLAGGIAGQLAAFLPKVRTVFNLWIFPESFLSGRIPVFVQTLTAVLIFIFPVLGLIFIRGFRKARVTEYIRRSLDLITLMCLLMICHELVILAVALLTYPPITINSRMFLPAYFAFGWMIALSVDVLTQWSRSKALKIAAVVISVLFCVYSGYRGLRIANQNAVDGLGYNAVSWKNSDTLAYLDANYLKSQVIVTNEETALLYRTGRLSWPMHEVYVGQPDSEYYAYESGPVKETDYGRKAFQDGNAVLVVFDSFEDQMADIYGDDTMKRIDALLENLALVYDGDDGKIFALP